MIIVAILEVFQGVEWTASAVGNMDTTIFYYLTGLITVLFVVYPGWKFLNMNKSALFGIALDVAMKRETMEKSTEKADDIFDKSEAAQGF